MELRFGPEFPVIGDLIRVNLTQILSNPRSNFSSTSDSIF